MYTFRNALLLKSIFEEYLADSGVVLVGEPFPPFASSAGVSRCGSSVGAGGSSVNMAGENKIEYYNRCVAEVHRISALRRAG